MSPRFLLIKASVACPKETCKAVIGEMCKTDTGKRANTLHNDRIFQAAKEGVIKL